MVENWRSIPTAGRVALIMIAFGLLILIGAALPRGFALGVGGIVAAIGVVIIVIDYLFHHDDYPL